MKKRTIFNARTVVIALLIAVAGVSLVTCVDQTILPLGTEAELLGLRIGAAVADEIPPAIAATAFESDSPIVSERFSTIRINREADTTVARISPSMSRGATARWGIGSRSNKPAAFFDTRVPITFESSEFIYIEVESADKEKKNYYRFNAHLQSWVTDLSRISVQERIAKAGTGGDSWELAADVADLLITTSEATNAVIVAETFDPDATIRYGRATSATAAPVFTPAATPITFTDQNYLYVEVTAANTIDKTYFKFLVNVGRMNTIKSLNFTGGPTTGGATLPNEEIYGLGLANSTWASVGKGEFQTPDQPTAGYGVTIELDDPDGTVDWTVLPTLPAAATNVTTWATTPKIPFSDGNYLVIRVIAKNGTGNARNNYYQIKLTMLAANIKTHPKSRAYMKNAPVEPLTVELDRAGNFSYQWYESDSWYGIYGRHGTALDEKNNISFVNGGPDMYYYLAQPDELVAGNPMRQPGGANEPIAWKAPTRKSGNTSDSYTPPNDWDNVPVKLRTTGQNSSYPFKPDLEEYGDGWGPNKVNYITGSTSESRYYWCVVKNLDNGYTVTTDRALIITETNPETKHFIFDLSVLKKKNETPFKIKRELYKIYFPESNYFPADFNPSEYEDLVAQAQYFLPDGRPWTQNWTHGDIHFGYGTKAEDDAGTTSSKGSLTWWQNNLGANSGAIPLQAPHSQQGGLGDVPDWVGVAPSGDPDRGLPPVDRNTGQLPVGYKPAGYAEGIAQGYFCGYIELLELRFASAPK
ncbi:MAG: hypothetical protein LBB72_07835 [Spirochaetaceae bacterium]|jgi:hypothetical protein|nr:hypothetical protein [Spirochaetaceae bacterium]